MTGTPYSILIAQARLQMNAAKGILGQNTGTSAYSVDTFWDDSELFEYAKRGTTDLWAAIIDLHQEHFLRINEDDVSLASGDTQLTGIPKDCFRVYLIEPLDATVNAVAFVPRPFNHIEFQNARAQTAGDGTQFFPTGGVNVFYCFTGAGVPTGDPVILTAPKLSAALDLRFSYISDLGVTGFDAKTATNPIPGNSDQALIAWIIAYARAKERDDRLPDPGWLAVYQTEKQSLLTRMAPRQEQEPQMIDGMFDDYWR